MLFKPIHYHILSPAATVGAEKQGEIHGFAFIRRKPFDNFKEGRPGYDIGIRLAIPGPFIDLNFNRVFAALRQIKSQAVQIIVGGGGRHSLHTIRCPGNLTRQGRICKVET
jgi:hypothetical protein